MAGGKSFQSPKIGSVVSNFFIGDVMVQAILTDESFNPLKSGQLFQIHSIVKLSNSLLNLFQSPKIGSVVSNKGLNMEKFTFTANKFQSPKIGSVVSNQLKGIVGFSTT